MSTTTFPGGVIGGVPPSPPPPTANYISQNLSNLGLGYAIAIALGFLVLLSTLLLASYVCCRASRHHHHHRHHHHQNPNPNPNHNNSSDNGIVLPRIIFVAEDDESNEIAAPGLDQSVINSYPKFNFKKDRNGNDGGNEMVCSICLCEYRDSEMLRVLPDCRHYFHLTCIDAWLKLNASCPVCRSSPLPTPLSTPLSEVVPLSQYSDGRRR